MTSTYHGVERGWTRLPFIGEKRSIKYKKIRDINKSFHKTIIIYRRLKMYETSRDRFIIYALRLPFVPE